MLIAISRTFSAASYVGRTKDFDTRMKHHNSPGGVAKVNVLTPSKKRYNNLTYEQARGMEQTLMVYYHTRKWVEEEGYNKINGISPKNMKREIYHEATVTYLENQIDNEYLNFKESLGSWW